MLSIELLARDQRASTLRQAERRERQRSLTAQLRPTDGRTWTAAARQTVGNVLVDLGQQIAGTAPDRASGRPIDRPA